MLKFKLSLSDFIVGYAMDATIYNFAAHQFITLKIS